MNTVNLIYSTQAELEKVILREELNTLAPFLIRVHTCIHTIETIKPFIAMLLSHFPNAKIIGCSTSGVIYNGGIMTDSCLISITELECSTVKTCLLPLKKDESDVKCSLLVQNIVDSVVTEDSRFMLAFFANTFIKIGHFVEHFNMSCGSVKLVGGVANTPLNPMTNTVVDAFVFDNDDVSDSCLAVAVIDSVQLSVYGDIVYATEPVGVCHTITDADGMIIRAIDGENAVDWYQKQLNISFSEDSDDDITVLFPLVRSDYGDIPWALAYSPQNENSRIFEDEPDPVMFVPSEAKVGEHVQISYSSTQKTIEVCEEVCKNLKKHPAEVIFGYSCISRQTLFTNCAKWELMPFKETNMSGCLIAGELGSMKDTNYYCNYSFVLASLAEKPRKMRIDTDILRRNSGELVNRQEHIIRYLVNMNEQAEEDSSLLSRQHEIEETLFKDDETGIGNLTKYAYDMSMERFDKVYMLSFRNENLLNAFMSKSKFNANLKWFYRAVMDFIDSDRFGFYVYKKNCLIITCSPEVSDDDFVEKMRALQNFAAEYKFGDYVPISEFSIVMHEEDMISKAELTLFSMRERNIFFAHYTSDLGLEQIHANKLKMQKVLTNAVANNRVIPYFQGIHDNAEGRVTMYESLMRIADENGVIYHPGQFMKIAKDDGFYPDISYQMIVKVMKFFRDRSDSVTINLNISDINNYKIVHFIVKYLKQVPHPENYVFELTETEEIRDYRIIEEFVEKIHQIGAKIAIDDFGSGFSNIVNIFKIGSDFIKIDGEIVRHINDDIYARECLEMIAGWAHKHGKLIIAEFVEEKAVQDIILSNNIRYTQGYLYSKPSPELK